MSLGLLPSSLLREYTRPTMSLKLQFSALSMGASVDQQTGALSVFELIEEVRTPQLPIQIPSVVISLGLLKTEPSDFTGKIFMHLITPDQKQQLIGNAELRIPIDQKRMKAVFRFGGFPVQNYGLHRFVLSWLNSQNQKVGEALLDFDVIQVAAQPGMENPPVAH